MAKHAIYAKTTSRFDAASKGVYHMLLRLPVFGVNPLYCFVFEVFV